MLTAKYLSNKINKIVETNNFMSKIDDIFYNFTQIAKKFACKVRGFDNDLTGVYFKYYDNFSDLSPEQKTKEAKDFAKKLSLNFKNSQLRYVTGIDGAVIDVKGTTGRFSGKNMFLCIVEVAPQSDGGPKNVRVTVLFHKDFLTLLDNIPSKIMDDYDQQEEIISEIKLRTNVVFSTILLTI